MILGEEIDRVGLGIAKDAERAGSAIRVGMFRILAGGGGGGGLMVPDNRSAESLADCMPPLESPVTLEHAMARMRRVGVRGGGSVGRVDIGGAVGITGPAWLNSREPLGQIS